MMLKSLLTVGVFVQTSTDALQLTRKVMSGKASENSFIERKVGKSDSHEIASLVAEAKAAASKAVRKEYAAMINKKPSQDSVETFKRYPDIKSDYEKSKVASANFWLVYQNGLKKGLYSDTILGKGDTNDGAHASTSVHVSSVTGKDALSSKDTNSSENVLKLRSTRRHTEEDDSQSSQIAYKSMKKQRKSRKTKADKKMATKQQKGTGVEDLKTAKKTSQAAASSGAPEANNKEAEEKAAKEKAAADKKAAERKAADEKAAKEKLAKQKQAQLAKQIAEKEKAAREKAAKEKAATEKDLKEKIAKDKAAKEKLEAQKKAQAAAKNLPHQAHVKEDKPDKTLKGTKKTKKSVVTPSLRFRGAK